MAEYEEVAIRRRDGRVFFVAPKNMKPSPFDVPGIKTRATTREILGAVAESRAGTSFADSEWLDPANPRDATSR